MPAEYVNAVPPPKMPTRPAGRIEPVIARFVLMDGSEEWRPATAVRWTDSFVLVGVGETFQRSYTWLRISDVAHVVRPARG